MILYGTGRVISSGKFQTKNGKEMKIVNIGEGTTFTSYQFVSSGSLEIPEKGTDVEYWVNLNKNGKYVNVFLTDIQPVATDEQ